MNTPSTPSTFLHVWEQCYAPALSPVIFPVEQQRVFHSFFASFAPYTSTLWGLEVPLGSQAPRDVLMRILPQRQALQGLAESVQRLQRHPLAVPEAWQALEDLVVHWQGEAARRDWYNLWLEFDQTELVAGRLVPNVFVGAEGRARSEVLQAWRQLPSPFGLSPGDLASLAKALEGLPRELRIFQLGFMQGREGEPQARLCFWPLSAENLLAMLKQVGWPGNLTAVAQLAQRLRGKASVLAVQLDWSFAQQTWLPKGGVEAYFRRPQSIEARLRQVLDEAVALGEALPEVVEQVFRYAGISAEVVSEAWPWELATLQCLYREQCLSTYARTLNHLKWSIDAAGATTLKAYLRAEHLWMPVQQWNALMRKGGLG